jgi:eukaryotic-like serine/threonine-protein kinase
MTVAPQTGWPPTVGRYLLYGEIASGGMATVHFGRLQGAAGFARSVAIKRLHPQYAKDPDFVGMFLDEARLAARIAHPNVVPTLDIVSQGDELLLVMEYVRGSSLSRLLRTLTQKGERMPTRIAAAITAGALRGLHAAHEAKSEAGEKLEIVHRDVSPQNVLVGTDGIARVLDFGVAKAAGRVQTTREGQLKGKLAYMAPEQITTGSVTRRTDVYAAAVVLWEMLTGRRLFRADNEAKLLALVLDSEVLAPSKLVEGLPSAFDQVVMKGLDRDPAKRYATAREMAIDVEAVVGIEPSTVIGEWVEVVAADELRERANRIEEIERSVLGSSPSGVSQSPHDFIQQSPSGSRRPDEPSTVQDGGRALPPVPKPPPLPASLKLPPPQTTPPPPPSTRQISQTSQVSNVAVAHTDAPLAFRRRPAGILVAAALAACAIGATVMALRPLRSNAAASMPASAPPPPTVPTTSPMTATREVPPAESPSPAPPPAPHGTSATPGSTQALGRIEGPGPSKLSPRSLPAAAPLPLPAATPPPQAVQGAASGPPASPRTALQAPRPPSSPQAGASECTPPYTMDDKGHKHFKPNCVN